MTMLSRDGWTFSGADWSLAVSDANRPRHCEVRVDTSVGTVSVFRAIFFDVDGTMLDDDADWRSAVAATAGLIADRYPPLSREELVSAYYDAATEIWRTVRDVQEAP